MKLRHSFTPLPLACCCLLILFCTTFASAETITLATYNIENFDEHFLARRVAEAKPGDKITDPEVRQMVADMLTELRNANDEDNWETAQVLLDPKFSPDILVIQEGCSQEELDEFNKKWLKGAYGTVIVFPGNSTRGQTLGLLAKPGFKIIQRMDQYHLEPDTVPNDRGQRLFARGPAFVLVESPSGYRIWVGNTHQKSKSGNSIEVTQWRNREAKRTHEIMKKLEKTGPTDVILLGDMNDASGFQEFEQEGDGDTIANLVGPADAGFVLATKPLADAGTITFGGYWNDRFRNCIDHIVVSGSMRDQVEEVSVFHNEFTAVSSDHYPVVIRIRADAAPSTRPGD